MNSAMKLTKTVLAFIFAAPMAVFGAESFYCPENHAYISIGMSQQDVVSACGEPLSKKQSDRPVTQKIPITQLVFNNTGTKTAFYGVWNIRTGSGGTRIEIDIVNNKVVAVRVNSEDSNAFSICGGTSINVGDPAGKVYSACGSPAITNNTFVYQPIPGDNKTEIWSYQASQYQQPVSLTFVNGKLQSID